MWPVPESSHPSLPHCPLRREALRGLAAGEPPHPTPEEACQSDRTGQEMTSRTPLTMGEIPSSFAALRPAFGFHQERNGGSGEVGGKRRPAQGGRLPAAHGLRRQVACWNPRSVTAGWLRSNDPPVPTRGSAKGRGNSNSVTDARGDFSAQGPRSHRSHRTQHKGEPRAPAPRPTRLGLGV